jgi:D-alanyl-D-alanine carboxypeptidase (penicillin-binding protein 5/6)
VIHAVLRLAVVAMALVAAIPALAAFETRAGAAWVYDVTTRTVLVSQNADTPLPPASMSKLMTLDMLFEALRDGRVAMDTRFGVSTRAREMGGSTMFLNERDRPTVEELIQGIIVLSGNDACVVVAEGLAGSEEAFARLMNARAKALGMTQSHFVNSSGWPAPGHEMSMADLGFLATRLVTEFPEYYGYFAQREFDFDGRAPQNRFNRNPLLDLGIGADGMKTGHTQEAGYGIVGSATQGTRRIVFVMTGLDSPEARSEEAERAVSWAFRQFVEKMVVAKGQKVASVDVWRGDAATIDLVADRDVTLLVPALQRGAIAAEATWRGPLTAPVSAGQTLGELVIAMEGLPETRVPLVADRDVGTGGFAPHLKVAAGQLLRDWTGIGTPDATVSTPTVATR